MRKCTYLYFVDSSLTNSVAFRLLLNVFFSSTVLMPSGTLFQLMGPWYTNAHSLYDLVLAVLMVNMFGSNDDLSGRAGVYTFKSSDRYFEYAVVSAVWHKESILWKILLGNGSQCNILRRGVVCWFLGILSVIRAAVFWTLWSFWKRHLVDPDRMLLQ